MDSPGDLQSFQVLPNFATLGPKFRKESSAVIKTIETMDDKSKSKIISILRDQKDTKVTIGKYTLDAEDLKLKVTTHEGFEAEEFKEGLVLLNVDLSDSSLVKEGLAKDVIRRIQSMRKDLGLEYDSEINLVVKSEENVVKEALSEFNDLISSETLSKNINFSDKKIMSDSNKEWEITTANGEKVVLTIGIEK